MTKFYAIKGEHNSNIFTTWGDVQNEIKNNKAHYGKLKQKSFVSREEAMAFIEGKAPEADGLVKGADLYLIQAVMSQSDAIFAFVDGSFNETTQTIGCGVSWTDGQNEWGHYAGRVRGDLTKHKQVPGECKGALVALKHILDRFQNEPDFFADVRNVYIMYDYMGVGKWATGEWKANYAFSKAYAEHAQALVAEIKQYADVGFVKVPAHITKQKQEAYIQKYPKLANAFKFNERADELADAGTKEA